MTPYLKKGWVLVNTSGTPDTDTCNVWLDHNVKPDMALYESPPAEGDKLCDASKMVSFGEFKIASQDEPFRYKSAYVCRRLLSERHGPSMEGLEIPPFERTSLDARDTRGQLTLYLNAIQATQHRTRVFGFYIRRNFCRLLCHSHSGTLVTPLIEYTKNKTLQTFFWRLTHASKADVGIDTSIEPVGPEDPHYLAARKHLSLESTEPLFRVAVNNAVPSKTDNVNYYYVSEPFTSSHIYPVGRGTRCFAAYDPVTQAVVFLKDTWRVDTYIPEHETYAKLYDGNVPNIPTVLAAGDVEGRWQSCGPELECNEKSRLRRHIHYRLVLRELGKPLGKFSSTHELVSAVLDAFRGM